MAKKFEIRNNTAEFLIFILEGKEDGIQVVYRNETTWYTQKVMSTLFDYFTDNIGLYLKNIFTSGELRKDSTTELFLVVQTEGGWQVPRKTSFYNLDTITPVGYRVNSARVTQFRRWCTSVTCQFVIRNYVISKKRMESGSFIGEGYFEHLLAEIRKIRLSERHSYQKLTDIYATATGYNRDAPTTRPSFQKVQNKIHYAVHGHTAVELIVNQASSEKEHMGLTTREDTPRGKIIKADVATAKSYLNEMELDDMEHLVSAVLDMVERMAKRHIPMIMGGWTRRIDLVLEAGGNDLSTNTGKVITELAKIFTEAGFGKYWVIQDHLSQSDFDRLNSETLFPTGFNPDNT